jgi:hypothetical protein
MPRHPHRIGYRHVAHLVLLLLALANSGCLLATAGIAGGAVAGYAYFNGKLCETYNASGDDAWAAVRTALAELGMPILKEEREGAGGFLESRAADGERVRIYVQTETSQFPAEGQLCRVCVRVATFGDRPVSDRVLDQVGMHLAPGAPVPPAAGNPGVIQTGAPPSSSPPAKLPAETGPPPLLPPEQAQMPTPTPK